MEKHLKPPLQTQLMALYGVLDFMRKFTQPKQETYMHLMDIIAQVRE